MRGELALTGSTALAAGLLLGFIMERLVRVAPSKPNATTLPRLRFPDRTESPGPPPDSSTTDVLERYRVVAAV